MKECVSVPFACLVILGLLIVSGVGCVTLEQNPPTGHAWPTTETEVESRCYITPECSAVTQCLQSIVGEPPHEPTEEGFDAIRDWVANNIEYETDQDRVGQKDYWETPVEILADPLVGDCEEFSILLCTLLRAYGIGADQVYVVIGVDRDAGAHAFLMEDWYLNGEWRAIDPQDAGQSPLGAFSLPLGSSRLDRYEIVAGFNDLYYHDGPFPWDELETNSSTLTNIVTTIEDIARFVSQFLSYVRGLSTNGE